MSVSSFNPAEAEDGFRSSIDFVFFVKIPGFNPAEAEDGFRRMNFYGQDLDNIVSIQPKPKTGLEVMALSSN